MPICPYFWKTLYALVVYCFVAWPWYVVRNFLRVNWRPTLVVLAMQAAILALVGIWSVRGDITAIPDRIAAWHKAEEAREAETRALAAKNDRIQREHEAFLRRHPDIAARERAEKEAWDREYEERQAKENALVMAVFKRDLVRVAPWIIGIATTGTLLIYFTNIVEIMLALFVLLIMIALRSAIATN